MANYKITRGWPADGALDDVLVPAVAGSISGGDIVMLDGNSEAVAADYALAGTNANVQSAFAIDVGNIDGKITALMGEFVVETSNLDPAGTFAVNSAVTAVAGQFSDNYDTATQSPKIIGTVMAYDAGTGIAKIKCSL